MIRKIISGGQTGVELAALDVAIKLGIAHGGWTPRGKRNEDGRLPAQYQVEEISSVSIQVAIEKNVADADGTLLISRGTKTMVVKCAVAAALEQQRQFLNIDLRQYPLFEAASLIGSWMAQKQIKTVFITGATASEDSLIYDQTKKILETSFYLGAVKSGLYPEHGHNWSNQTKDEPESYPQTVQDSVNKLKSVLALKDRTMLANMQIDELDHLHMGLGEYIKQHFGLYSGNHPLLNSCAEIGRLTQPLPDEACSVIVRALWEELRQTHRLRLVK